jgi:hypothetical protein
MSDQKIILVNELKNRVRLYYYWSLGFIFLIIISIFYFLNLDSLFSFFVALFFGSTFMPNFITLYLIKCPYCSKKYFNPKICGDKGLKKILNSKLSCVHCKNRASIFIEDLSNNLN